MPRREERFVAPIDDLPYPRPLFTWRRRILFLIIAIAAIAATWGIWRYHAEAEIDRAIASLRTAGQPALPDDFDEPAVSQNANAVTWLRRIHVTPDSTDNLDDASDFSKFPLPPEMAQRVEAWARDHREMIDNLRRAEACPALNWYEKPMDRVVVWEGWTWTAYVRLLDQNIGRLAIAAAQRGDFDSSLRYIEDLNFIARAVRAQETTFGMFMGDAMDGLTCEEICNVVMLMKAGGLTTPQRDAVRRIITDLLDDSWRNQRDLRAMQREKMVALWYAKHPATTRFEWGRGEIPLSRWEIALSILARPYDDREAIAVLKKVDRMMGVISAAQWSIARSATIGIDLRQTQNTGVQPVEYMRLQAPQFWISPIARYRVWMDRRVTATALAARAYQMEHGWFPATLTELAPEFFPAPPIDPYAANGRTVGYHAGVDPYVYSVFENGIDDTAKIPPTRKMSSAWGEADFIVYLTMEKLQLRRP